MNVQPTKIQRLKDVLQARKIGKTTHYAEISDGIFPPPFSLGARAKGYFEHETMAILAARAAGKNDDELRSLVSRLLQARQEMAETYN